MTDLHVKVILPKKMFSIKATELLPTFLNCVFKTIKIESVPQYFTCFHPNDLRELSAASWEKNVCRLIGGVTQFCTFRNKGFWANLCETQAKASQ